MNWLTKFRGFTHAVAVAIVSASGSAAYYLMTHPAALQAINDFLATVAVLMGLSGWFFGFRILGHGWDLVSFNKNSEDCDKGEKLTLLGGVLIMLGTVFILMAI